MDQDQPDPQAIPICDYEGSDYQARFWTNQGRAYEDLAERIAIRHMLPPQGGCLLEIGTGFGRLVDLYQGYERIVLLDYSRSMLRQAQERLGQGGKYTYVAANLYDMPLVDRLVDTVCMIRVIHHVADVTGALYQIHRVLRPDGTFVLEYANKRNLKAILRYALGRQSWSPFDPEPVEFVSLNYDYHPRWMNARLADQGFAVEQTRTVSHLRVPALKRALPARALAAIDGAVQWTGRWWQYTPSVFVRSRRGGQTAGKRPGLPTDPGDLFQCPACTGRRWQQTTSEMHCSSCGTRWPIDDGIYNFKEPRPSA